MKIKAKIDRVVEGSSVKAIASATLDGQYVIKNMRVIDGRKGMFVAMPQESFKGKDGSVKYSNVFFPITNMAKEDLQNAVLAAYEQHMHQEQEHAPAPEWSGGYDEMLPMGF